MIQNIINVIQTVANILSIGVSLIAIYVFITQKEKIASAIDALLNYSFNLSINELRHKLERLNDYNAGEKEHISSVLNLLNDIQGHLKGNKTLKNNFEEIINKIQEFTDVPKNLTEPRKRSLVSELREGLRGIDISNYKKIVK